MNCDGASKAIPNTFLNKKNNIVGFWMYFIRFFLAFFIINDNISHKEESNGFREDYDQKNGGKEKKTWNAIFFMDNLPVLRIFFAILSGIKDFYKQRFIFFSLFITVLFSVFSYPFGNDYYNGFFTINYMIDFSGQFCQAKVLNEIFLTVS